MKNCDWIGVSRSVGAGGGFSLGGGHGPLSPLHGLAVDSTLVLLPVKARLIFDLKDILEITVVLATGDVVKASPFHHPNLFAALRGGGSAFGCVVEVVFKVHTPPCDGFIGVLGEFSIVANATNGAKAWQALVRKWIGLQTKLSDVGFSGYSYVVRSSNWET